MRRRLALETIGLEVFASLDGQGLPSYAVSVDVKGHVVREDELVLLPDGSQVRSDLRIYVGPDAPAAAHKDRVTPDDGIAYIVLKSREVKTLSGVVDHYELQAREE